ncbi:hypothetical protein CkaCkLH20_01704 [Colletotrichum karsti]|uniref:Uncharacterized protein n=1 Tax=Colletotrichum karsti TaxID=1095194 RepID=A0A9P6IC43_9PEZI|nr:uncharacterized protein CkaCkLH20_01704 [Colletotrichum karsti]KAF9880662.1 hypothetical protein CkaCkLH20_01704 [Colletotrichum karsti]
MWIYDHENTGQYRPLGTLDYFYVFLKSAITFCIVSGIVPPTWPRSARYALIGGLHKALISWMNGDNPFTGFCGGLMGVAWLAGVIDVFRGLILIASTELKLPLIQVDAEE